MKQALAVLLVCPVVFLAGCGIVDVSIGGQSIDTSSPGAAISSAKDNAAIAACATVRQRIDQQYTIAQNNALDANVTVSFGSLVSKLGVKCPTGGAFEWDEAAGATRCSIHGE